MVFTCFHSLRPKPKGRVAANFTVWEAQGSVERWNGERFVHIPPLNGKKTENHRLKKLTFQGIYMLVLWRVVCNRFFSVFSYDQTWSKHWMLRHLSSSMWRYFCLQIEWPYLCWDLLFEVYTCALFSACVFRKKYCTSCCRKEYV